ncbi:hypothetical protein [Streptomyces sp. SID12501]|uniref:hypothetical protein n=1 Tax=Streptomyces sp. SID12501 TaxID=2706042 RepID=UPI001EF331EB|nr:hypothetical protein [Streptomyces sp. SID12501]
MTSVACGGGSDSGDSAAGASGTQAAAPAQDGAAEAGGGDPVETPLTGEAKEKAEAAALAAYPGTVVKSEEDAENPGMYAVEITGRPTTARSRTSAAITRGQNT